MHGPRVCSRGLLEFPCSRSELQCRESASRTAEVLGCKFSEAYFLVNNVLLATRLYELAVPVVVQEQVENLGPVVGPLIFVLTMASAEMIPLFPTQPLSLASGLLFGPVQVCLCHLPFHEVHCFKRSVSCCHMQEEQTP